MEKIIIIGGKGSTVGTAEMIDDARQRYGAKYELLGFCIDDPLLGSEINGFPIVCKMNELCNKYDKFDDVKYIFSLYKPSCMEDRVKLLNKMNIASHKFANFIHPTAYIAKSAVVGYGNVFAPNVIVNSNTIIGNHNAFYGQVVIEHDTIVGNNNFFAATSAIGSEIQIGNGNFFGLHSTVREHVKIGDYNIIGMGAGVLKDIQSNTTVVGLPARAL